MYIVKIDVKILQGKVIKKDGVVPVSRNMHLYAQDVKEDHTHHVHCTQQVAMTVVRGIGCKISVNL